MKLIKLHSTVIPLLIGSALIVSTDDHTSTDILLVVTDISLSWLLGSVSKLPPTDHCSKSPIPSQVKLANVYSEVVTDEEVLVITVIRKEFNYSTNYKWFTSCINPSKSK